MKAVALFAARSRPGRFPSSGAVISWQAFAVLILLMFLSCTNEPRRSFRVDYNSSGCAEWVATGDLNGDGLDDAVVASPNDAMVVVYLGQREGGMDGARRIPFAGRARGLNLADLDGDGNLDLATVSAVPSFVAVAMGDGLGDFGPPEVYDVPTLLQTDDGGPDSVSIADVNNDRSPDLIIGYGEAAMETSVTWFAGVGDGRFLAAAQIPVGGTRPRYSVVAEVTGDSYPDLVTVLGADNLLTVVELDEAGRSRGVWQSFPTGEMPSHLTTGDFNGNGRTDFVTANSQGQSVSIFLARQTAGLSPALTIAVQRKPQAVLVADFDRDGAPDIAAAASGNDYLTLIRGSGDGTFQSARHYPAGHCANSLAIGDLDGDGTDSEILIANCGEKSLSSFQLPRTPRQLALDIWESRDNVEQQELACLTNCEGLSRAPSP